MADAIIKQGHLTQAQFDANPTFILGDGQIAWLKDNSGKFKKGDGVTVLNALPFIQYSKDLATVLGVGNSTSGENIIITNADSIKSSKVTNPSNINFGANGEEILISNDDDNFTKAWLYGSDNEMSIGHVDNLIKVKVSDITLEHDTLIDVKTPKGGINTDVGNGTTIYSDSGVVGEFAKMQSFEGANILQADLLNKFDAPDNHFPNEIASKIAVFDASKNLKSGTVNESDLELKSNKGTVLGNLTSTTIYTHAKAVVDYVASLGYITISALTGYIKGSVGATAGRVPFGTGVADTVTSSDNQIFIDANKRMQLGNTYGTTWDFHTYAFDAGNNSIVYGASGDFHLVSNARGLGTWTRYGTGRAINQYMYDGDMVTRTAVSSSAGSAITWIEQFKVKNAGGVGINDKSFFGDTTTTATAYGDFKAGTTSIASMRIRAGVLPTTQLDGEINYVGTRLHHYNGIDNTIAYLSDIAQSYTTIDFGNNPINEKSFTITDSNCLTTSKIDIDTYYKSQIEENFGVKIDLFTECFNGSFNIIAICRYPTYKVKGQFNIKYKINN